MWVELEVWSPVGVGGAGGVVGCERWMEVEGWSHVVVAWRDGPMW